MPARGAAGHRAVCRGRGVGGGHRVAPTEVRWTVRGRGRRSAGPLQRRRPAGQRLQRGAAFPERAAAQVHPTVGQHSIPATPDHAETVSAVKQITGGNFRLIERLMTQIARVMGINQLEAITPDVVHAARQILVIGAQ